jgi:antitoxin component YwqK of YwqJK toxin-antitoxin module
MNYKIILISILSILPFSSIISQEKIQYQSAIDAYIEGIGYYAQENYEDAYNAFAQINYNDTAYFQAQVLAISCASIDERYDTILNLANEVLQVRRKNPLKESFLNAKGSALLKKEKLEEALQVFDASILEYPQSALLRFNRAEVKYESGDYSGAVEDLQDAIRYNPRSIMSQIKLGDICAESGHPTRAALCYNAAILIDATSGSTIETIDKLKALYAGETEQKEFDITFIEDEDFEDTDELITSKSATDAKFKNQSKLSFDFVKYNQQLFESIVHNSSDEGFWSQNYIQIFSDIYTKGYAADYSYYSCILIEDAYVQKIIKKKINKIKEFMNWRAVFYTANMNNRIVRENGKYVDNYLNQTGSYGFDYKAELENGIPVGEYIGYSKNGLVSTLGSFNSRGKLDGKWQYFDDQGNIVASKNFSDGELDGLYSTYYVNGSRSKEFRIVDNKISGDIINFYTCNQPYSQIRTNDAGQLEGTSKYFHSIGELSHSVEYVNDLIQGELKKYYADGTLRQTLNYDNGRLNGAYESYYKSGKLYAKGTYDEGLETGKWTFLHQNGELIEEGIFKNGLKIGVWKENNDEGILISETDYGETGKKTGTYSAYDNDGNKEYELNYKGSEILSYTIYNSAGEIIKEGKKSKKYLEFENYHSNGELMVKGNYYKSEKTGTWKFYNEYGTLTSEVPYNEGLEDGTAITYFETGEIDSKTEYKNGLADGYYEEFYRNGNLYSQGWYVAGSKVGSWEYYHRDGEVRVKEYYLEGQSQGDIEFYNESGHLSEIGVYYYGDYEGTIIYDSLGTEIGSYFLKDGAGSFDMKDMNGKTSASLNYKGGVKHGAYHYYDLNNIARTKGEYFNGSKVGKWTYYRANGALSAEGMYANDNDEGEWKWYYEDGTLRSKEQYVDGQQHGQDTSYHDDGTLASIRTFRHGKENGKTYYYLEGELQYIRVYKDDILQGYSYLDKTGNEMPLQKYAKGDFTIKTFYKSGTPSHESELKNGYSHGKSDYYFPNGKLNVHKTFVDGQLNGAYNEFYNTGKPKIKCNYRDGDLNGEYIKYWPNGKMKSKLNYKLDEKFGWAYEYDQNGNETAKKFYYSDRQLK